MIKKLLTCSLSVFLLISTLPLQAEDLMQVYHQALVSDPTFKKAEADWLTARQDFPIARAGNGTPGSGLFPYFNVSGEIDRSYQKQVSGNFSTDGYFNGNSYLLQLTQPIFNYATWKTISSAKFSVRAAAATYLSASQDLMFRVSQAYFNVLRAYDKLQYTLAQKKSFLHQLITARQQFDVGLIAITGVYDAQASYDQSVAQEVQDRNNLQDQLENLRAITGVKYEYIEGLRTVVPLVVPQPQNMESWVSIASQQNYLIKSNLYTMLSARETIKQTRAAGYPTLTGTANYGAITTGVIPGIGQAVVTPNSGGLASFTTTTANAALNLNFPAYQGGFVGATTKQAEYKYLSASDQLEFTHRDVIRQTREAYLGVRSGISKVQADRQAIISAANKLDATEAGYQVGTRTMVDVLNAVTQLYQAQQQWADDRYDYVISIVSLKEQAGTLSPHDLALINAWLSKQINLRFKQVEVKTPQITHPLPKPNHQNVTPPPGGKPVRRFYGSRTPLLHLAGLKNVEPAKTVTALNYAIQVFATHDLSQAHDFVNQQKQKGQLQVIMVEGQPNWYKVMYGQFATEKAALNALPQLPIALKKNKPWVVNVSEILSKAPVPATVPAESTLPAPAESSLPKVNAEDQITSFEEKS